MSYYDDIYDFAVDNNYLISTEDARNLGIPAVELAKLAHRGRLENLSRGLYRLARWIPSAPYPYAEAVARVGEGAYLYGESVIALLELAPTNPAYVLVASPKRMRRKLPEGIRVKRPAPDDAIIFYDGVPCQHIRCALPAATSSMPEERLEDAAARACREGYLLPRDYETLKRRMGWPR